MHRDGKQHGFEAHDPTDRCKEHQSSDHGENEADGSTFGALLWWQAIREDGNENDVIDAENDF